MLQHILGFLGKVARHKHKRRHMKYSNPIPDKTDCLIHLNQLKCNNMIEYYQKNQQHLYVIHKIRIGYRLFLRIFAHFIHLVIIL